jgi:hypothetical protein
LPGGRRATMGWACVGATLRTSPHARPSRRSSAGVSACWSRGKSSSSSSRTSSRSRAIAADEVLATRVAAAAAVDGGHDLVDLLVLALDLDGQRLAVRERPARRGPEHRLLRERVREDEAAEVLERLVLGIARRRLDPPDQAVELLVVAALAHEDAARTAQLGVGLLGDRAQGEVVVPRRHAAGATRARRASSAPVRRSPRRARPAGAAAPDSDGRAGAA